VDINELFKEEFFWLFTTIGSVFLSVVSNLVTPFIRSKISSVKKKNKDYDSKIVSYLKKDKNKRIMLRLDVIHQLLWSILIQAFTVSIILADRGGVGSLIGIFMTILNIYFMNQSISMYRYIKLSESGEDDGFRKCLEDDKGV